MSTPAGIRHRILAALVGALLGATGSFAACAPKPSGLLPLREVRLPIEERAQVWLLGSVHYRERGEQSVDARVLEAFEAADTLVVELDPARRETELGLLVGVHGLYHDGSTVWDHLAPDLHALLREAMEVFPKGQTLQADKMKPWLLGVSLSAAGMAGCGYTSDSGVDALLLASARGKKQIGEVETAEEQIRALSSVDPQGQVASLRDTLRELPGLCETMRAIFEAWGRGDLPRLQRLTLDKVAANRELDSFYRSVSQTATAGWPPPSRTWR